MPSILYLHGFASGPSSAKATLTRAWADERRLPIAIPDLNGAGFSTLTVQSQLDIAHAALATLPKPVVAVGSSLGGYLVALMQEGGAELASCLLMAPAFDFARRLSRALGRDAVEQWRREGSMSVYHHSERDTRSVGIAIIDEGPRFTAMPEMRIACTIVHGTQDVEVPVELSRLYARDNPRVTLVEVEDDHTLMAGFPRVVEELERLVGAA